MHQQSFSEQVGVGMLGYPGNPVAKQPVQNKPMYIYIHI